MKRAATLLCIALTLAACQDHHFIPMEKADKIKLPSGQGDSKGGFTEDPSAQKQVMADAYKTAAPTPPDRPPAPKLPANAPAGGIIVSGTLELGPAQKNADFTGWTIYVLVKTPDKQGPPLAVVRLAAGKFPMPFTVDNGNLMMGTPPAKGEKLIAEARLDKDGDPMTKVPGDVFGFTASPFTAGDKGIKVPLDQLRK